MDELENGESETLPHVFWLITRRLGIGAERQCQDSELILHPFLLELLMNKKRTVSQPARERERERARATERERETSNPAAEKSTTKHAGCAVVAGADPPFGGASHVSRSL